MKNAYIYVPHFRCIFIKLKFFDEVLEIVTPLSILYVNFTSSKNMKRLFQIIFLKLFKTSQLRSFQLQHHFDILTSKLQQHYFKTFYKNLMVTE